MPGDDNPAILLAAGGVGTEQKMLRRRGSVQDMHMTSKFVYGICISYLKVEGIALKEHVLPGPFADDQQNLLALVRTSLSTRC